MNANDRYDSLFQWYGSQEGVDWLLLKAQDRRESAFNPDARSRVGALGLAQFMKKTWEEWRDGTPGIQEPPPDVNPVDIDPRNPEACIHAQAAYMAWLLKIFPETGKALAAYNWGVGNVKKRLAVHAGDFEAALMEMPPETQDYVRIVMQYYGSYQASNSS